MDEITEPEQEFIRAKHAASKRALGAPGSNGSNKNPLSAASEITVKGGPETRFPTGKILIIDAPGSDCYLGSVF
jgi:hypothetical protein